MNYRHLKRTLSQIHPEFSSDNQQDVQSFIIGLLDHVSNDFKSYNEAALISDHAYSKPQMEIEDFYEIRFQEKFFCEICKGAKTKDLTRFDLLLQLDEEIKDYILEDLILKYFETEKKDVYCANPACKYYNIRTSHVQKFELESPPKCLILSVKRYFFSTA